jgi:DNA-directed RNA polymerase specialized sigma24 family protein
VARWEVGMHETARDLCGQLDSKMGALSALVHEADRAAARLEAALEAAGQRPDQTGAPAPAAGRPSDSSSPLDPLPPQPANQAEALKSAGAADRLSVSRHVSQEAGKLRPSIDERYEEIYLLADYGFAAAEIARRVGSPVGEVELILGLRGKR